MRAGVRLAIDVGKARIGVARCDPHAMLATPVETVARVSNGDTDIARLVELVGDVEAFEVVVGLPLGLGGHRTPSTDDAEEFAKRLVRALGATAATERPVAVRLVDERLSTVAAQSNLRAAGRNTKQSRNVIDQAAAVVILEHALEMERGLGRPPGTVVESQTIEHNQDAPPAEESDPA
ncbi:MAG: Holliday junction resolvase RuvX [Microbacteriaceae bacterium]|nr:Holliday junction resolvase RuvX [Microbacteriaceae bacterium]